MNKNYIFISLDDHKKKIASPTELGHVKVDGTTITINQDGVISSQGGGTTTPKIYGVRIDKANSNPETSVTYINDAIGMVGGSTDWDNIYPFNKIKPCVFQGGQVNYYLNPNDFTQKEDGTTADITSGADGDVMIEFPKVYWRITSNDNEVYVQFSKDRIDERWKCLAHTRGDIERDTIYIGAYLGYYDGTSLRSLSGKTPTTNQTIGAFRNNAQANGIGYEQMPYLQLLMLQILYLIRYKSLDSQTAIGRGFVDDNSSAANTGGSDAKGMNFGEATGKQQMKFAGVEDFWGNCHYWIDGLFIDSNLNILIGNDNFNDTGNGYNNYGQGSSSSIAGYLNDIQGSSETGFIAKSTSGSETTFYCDYGSLNSGVLPYFGGYWSYASGTGAFRLTVSYIASSSYPNASARLCYL